MALLLLIGFVIILYYLFVRIPLQRAMSKLLPESDRLEISKSVPFRTLGMAAFIPYTVWMPFIIAVLVEIIGFPNGTAVHLPDIQAALATQQSNPLVLFFSFPINWFSVSQWSFLVVIMRFIVASLWLVCAIYMVPVVLDHRFNDLATARIFFIRVVGTFLTISGVYLLLVSLFAFLS